MRRARVKSRQRGQEKGVDVWLALDALVMCTRQDLDCVVIASADRDLDLIPDYVRMVPVNEDTTVVQAQVLADHRDLRKNPAYDDTIAIDRSVFEFARDDFDYSQPLDDDAVVAFVTRIGAVAPGFDLGTAGAGTGATTANLKGGLGSASLVLPSGHKVGALVAVNALGSAIVGDGPQFWAAPFEIGDEFGGLGPASDFPDMQLPATKLSQHASTTIGIVATDAALTQAQCTRMATAAHDGFARALVPSHTPMDGDLIFTAATGARALIDPLADTLMLGHAAATCMARAIARAVFHASAAKADTLPCWQGRFG